MSGLLEPEIILPWQQAAGVQGGAVRELVVALLDEASQSRRGKRPL